MDCISDISSLETIGAAAVVHRDFKQRVMAARDEHVASCLLCEDLIVLYHFRQLCITKGKCASLEAGGAAAVVH